MLVFAEYIGEEIVVTFSANMNRTDYGVAGSPEFDELDPYSIEAVHLTICGIIVKFADLPNDLHDAIISFSDGLEWEA